MELIRQKKEKLPPGKTPLGEDILDGSDSELSFSDDPSGGSDSGMESSLAGSATKWASRRCSRLALVVVVIAFSNMSFAS